MGASFTEQIAAGKTPAEAYRNARESAASEYGHQEGYSGAINSKAQGFAYVELPARFTYRRFQSLLEAYNDAEGSIGSYESDVRWSRDLLATAKSRSEIAAAKRRLVAAERDLAKARKTLAKIEASAPPSLWNLDRLAATYYDKWDAPLCVELRGAEAKRYSTYHPRKRGERLYIFFGYAPS